MNRTPVSSRLLSSVGYDDANGILEAQFLTSGAVYRYPNVPRAAYDALMAADSVGSAFLRTIKPQFQGIKIDESASGGSAPGLDAPSSDLATGVPV